MILDHHLLKIIWRRRDFFKDYFVLNPGTCKRIRMEGSTEHDNRMGVYFQLSKSRWCHERPSYKLSESRGTHYMYYNEILELNFEGWMIGSGLCENEVRI